MATNANPYLKSNGPRKLLHQLGQADSTAGNMSAALALANIFREGRDLLPIEESAMEEFEGDNLQQFMVDIAFWMARTPIPKFRNKDNPMVPSNPENKQCLCAVTLKGYIGQIFLYLKRKFPGHEDFADKGQNPTWWEGFCAMFMKEATRFQIKIGGSDDIVFGSRDARPLYRNNAEPPAWTDHLTEEDLSESWFSADSCSGGPEATDPVSMIDLKFVCRRLFWGSDGSLRNKNLEDRLILLTAYHCAGRGSECKTVSFDNWVYHPRWQTLDIGWGELKTMVHYCMPMVPDACLWQLDWFHALGCHWAVDKALIRSSLNKKDGTYNALFPSLHRCSENKIADRISGIIRNNLPRGTPKSVVTGLSSRSVRKSSVTEISLHPQCGIFETTGS